MGNSKTMNSGLHHSSASRTFLDNLRCAAALCACFLASCSSHQPPQDAEKRFAVRDVTIFDGVRFQPHRTVIVQGAEIASVGSANETPTSSVAEVIDGAGHTLLPGLIDAHTHAGMPAALQQSLVVGVTTQLEMFGGGPLFAELKKAGRDADKSELFSAGAGATAPGGHGTEYGFPSPTISGPEEAQSFVDARLREGSDYLKIIYQQPSPGERSLANISKETLVALVAAAHRRDKLAVVHIWSQSDARDAVEAGADGLVHLFLDRYPDPDFAQLAAQHDVFVVPTLTLLESASGTPSGASLVGDSRLAVAIAPSDAENLKAASTPRAGRVRIYGAAQETLRQLKAKQVPILAGSDAPNQGTAHGVSLHRELELLVGAGLTTAEAVASATSVPAQRFRLNDRGRIAAGLRADLLLVRGNPESEIEATRDIIAIWKRGTRVNRSAFQATLQEEKRRMEVLLALIRDGPRDGNAAVVERYRQLRQKGANVFHYSEDELISWGFALLDQSPQQAIEMLRLGAEAYPESSPIFHFLGTAYVQNEERSLAIQSFEKSLQLNPGNTRAIQMLHELRASR
ncbi:MAG: amidohydrolase family protein [Acidobacteria bacterium]|nr:amidohydrolase family protein [Acidobacteriota bacterium]